MIAGMIDLFWPRTCPICAAEISPAEGDLPLHDTCLAGLPPARESGRGPVPVWARFEDSPQWFALLHAWKYGGQRDLAGPVARAMVDRYPAWEDSARVLVPMPDDPARRLERGYSPVFDLARALGALTSVAVDAALLVRRIAVPSQTACSDDLQRAANARRALRTADLSRRHRAVTLVLVEDQVTSGASVRAATRLLRARGHRVAVWCAARAARAPVGLA